ncbi:MAG: DUF3108 domain-containing protein [Lentimicrobiaceae bacterium]|nr:DUF3108 domain-containing protein [Lentimicrobiaceae bacterium]
MRNILFTGLWILLFLSPLIVFPQTYRTVKNDAFKRGEKFTFRVYYDSFITGKVTAGSATLEVTQTQKPFYNRNTYHVVGVGKSAKFFDWFFKVNDRFETYFDEESFAPYYFVRRTREGGYTIDDDVYFRHLNNTARSRKNITPVPVNVQDILSAYYFARTLDISNLSPGDYIKIPFFLDDTTYVSAIQYVGKEIVKTSLGKFRCLKLKPMVATGEVFSNPYPMTLWISDDKNRIPILGQSAVVVGNVKMELINFSGLSNPFTSKIK